MVTVRTYLNSAQAALDKSLLDDYGIFCSVADENAHLYGGGPLAMPIRLLVDEEHAAEATRILESAAQEPMDPAESIDEKPPVIAKDNPWELLVIAALFLVPGICALQLQYPATVASKRAYSAAVAMSVFHFFGWLAVAVAAILIGLYFFMLRSSRTTRDFYIEAEGNRRGL